MRFYKVMLGGTCAAALGVAALTLVYPVPQSTAQSLGSFRAQNMTPSDGFRYFSGHRDSLHNHPAIYAWGTGDGAHLTVVGAGYEQKFPLADRAQAFAAYEALLKATNYLNR